MPAAQSERAMDSARIRCAALAGAKAAVLGIPRRDAVAPMKMILPRASAFHGGDHLPGDEQGSQGIDAPSSLKRLWRDLLDRTPGT